MIKEGDRITTWFSDEPDGKSTVLKVHPYTGAFPLFFNCILELTAPRTRAGSLEMAYKDEDGLPCFSDASKLQQKDRSNSGKRH